MSNFGMINSILFNQMGVAKSHEGRNISYLPLYSDATEGLKKYYVWSQGEFLFSSHQSLFWKVTVHIFYNVQSLAL